MPVYHASAVFAAEPASAALGGALPLLPLAPPVPRGGPAPALGGDAARDIVEEALAFYRSNVLHLSFKIESPADVLLVYLTLFISQCLRRLDGARPPTATDAQRLLGVLATTDAQQPVPGVAGWPLEGLVPPPADPAVAGACRVCGRGAEGRGGGEERVAGEPGEPPHTALVAGRHAPAEPPAAGEERRVTAPALGPLPPVCPLPCPRPRAESLRGYLRQLREATVPRLVARVYADAAGGAAGPSKHWLMFAARRFMGRELP